MTKPARPFVRAAKALREHGFAPIPLEPKSKKPAISGWPSYVDDLPTLQQIDAWVSEFPEAGVGILLGTRISPESDDLLVAVDIDNDVLVEPIAEAIVEANKSGEFRMVGKRGARGVTYFVRARGGVVSKSVKGSGGMLVEILAKGRQTVLPPSIHPTGTNFRWQAGVSLLDIGAEHLPVVTPETIATIQQIAERCDPDRLGQADSRPVEPDIGPQIAPKLNYSGKGQFDNVDMDYPGNVNETLCRMAAVAARWNHENGKLDKEGKGEVVSGMMVEAMKAAHAGGVADEWDVHVQLQEANDQYDRAVEKGLAEWGWSEESVPKKTEDVPVLRIVEPSSLQGQEVREREWFVPGWIPKGAVTALSGDGGTGKTLLAQQLMFACSTSSHWLGLPTTACKTFGVFCEDTERELHIRLASMCQAHSVQFSDLGDMQYTSRVSDDNMLMRFGGGDDGRLTDFWHVLNKHLVESGTQLLVVDTASDTFGGNEIYRSHVRQFIANALTRLAVNMNGAVLMCMHPSVHGMEKGTGSSGSTAWNNSVRSRLYLKRPDKRKGEDADPDRRILSIQKSNYGPAGDEFELTWKGGNFVREGVKTEQDRNIQTAEDAQVFLAAMDVLERQGTHLSSSQNSEYYAPRQIAELQDDLSLPVARGKAAMKYLLNARSIEHVQVGSKSKGRMVLRRADKGG